MDPPPLPPKCNNYTELGNIPPSHLKYHHSVTPECDGSIKRRILKGFFVKRRGSVRRKPTSPPIPLRRQSSGKINLPPPLPLKRHRYNKDDQKIFGKHQSKEYHRVISYTARGMTFYECDHITFYNQAEATRYCQIINNNMGSKRRKNYWEYTPIIANSKNSFTQPISDLMYRKNSISGSDNFLMKKKNSLSERSSTLPGLSRSISKQSSTKSNNDQSS
uniref:Chitin-binding type-2 domain-containing protein n=1 Tax=Strongyloides papillosus TaxID=174720 RepID=A0A0N5B1X1_STREA